MQITARSCIIAAVLLGAGSIIAVTSPVRPSLPDVQVPAVQLTTGSGLDDIFNSGTVATDIQDLVGDGVGGVSSDAMPSTVDNGGFADELRAAMLAFNTDLINGQLGFNKAFVANELGVQISPFFELPGPQGP